MAIPGMDTQYKEDLIQEAQALGDSVGEFVDDLFYISTERKVLVGDINMNTHTLSGKITNLQSLVNELSSNVIRTITGQDGILAISGDNGQITLSLDGGSIDVAKIKGAEGGDVKYLKSTNGVVEWAPLTIPTYNSGAGIRVSNDVIDLIGFSTVTNNAILRKVDDGVGSVSVGGGLSYDNNGNLTVNWVSMPEIGQGKLTLRTNGGISWETTNNSSGYGITGMNGSSATADKFLNQLGQWIDLSASLGGLYSAGNGINFDNYDNHTRINVNIAENRGLSYHGPGSNQIKIQGMGDGPEYYFLDQTNQWRSPTSIANALKNDLENILDFGSDGDWMPITGAEIEENFTVIAGIESNVVFGKKHLTYTGGSSGNWVPSGDILYNIRTHGTNVSTLTLSGSSTWDIEGNRSAKNGMSVKIGYNVEISSTDDISSHNPNTSLSARIGRDAFDVFQIPLRYINTYDTSSQDYIDITDSRKLPSGSGQPNHGVDSLSGQDMLNIFGDNGLHIITCDPNIGGHFRFRVGRSINSIYGNKEIWSGRPTLFIDNLDGDQWINVASFGGW